VPPTAARPSVRRGGARAPGAAARRRRRPCGDLGLGRTGHLHGRAEDRVGRGVLVGEGQEPLPQLRADADGPLVECRVLGVLWTTGGQAGDHRDEGRSERGGHGRGTAAARHRLRGGEARDEFVDGQIAETRSIGIHHDRSYTSEPWSSAASPRYGTPCVGRETGRARYRRTRPVVRRSRAAEREGVRRREGEARQAAVRTSSRPVTVQRRERCWNVSDRRARGVSTSNSVRGPVMTG
jgi:hypothetical protein